MSIVTYHLTSDYKGKLRSSAKLSCSFWNKYIMPDTDIVIRLGTFTSFGRTIARAYEPYRRDGVVYGVVEFNTTYLDRFSEDDITGTIIHEIGHTLGIGWDKWMDLFYVKTGKFKQKYIKKVPDLAKMVVELDYDAGTTLAHWDEEKFEKELMSGFKSDDEYVLPVTIDVMSLLGHQVIERLKSKRSLSVILNNLRKVKFSRQEDVSQINRDVFIETPIMEEIYEEKK